MLFCCSAFSHPSQVLVYRAFRHAINARCAKFDLKRSKLQEKQPFLKGKKAQG
jgi:hypothetical protein